jgi:thioesterase domain-containing protein
VAIQPVGSKPPLFCVHELFGTVFPYYDLAHDLGNDRPVYGLLPLGIDGEQRPYTRIEDMASDYVRALRVLYPEGPYCLGGYSFGGLVAFEMAQQLHKEGHQVGLLALLETWVPISVNTPPFLNTVKFHFALSMGMWPYIYDYFFSVSKLPKPAIRSMRRVLEANIKALLSYVPRTYPNRITLFRTYESFVKGRQDPTMGWSKIATGGVEVHRVPGDHLTVMRKPHVQVLAQKLRACLDGAQR